MTLNLLPPSYSCHDVHYIDYIIPHISLIDPGHVALTLLLFCHVRFHNPSTGSHPAASSRHTHHRFERILLFKGMSIYAVSPPPGTHGFIVI